MEDIFFSDRLNIYWYLSFIAPAVIMLTVTKFEKKYIFVIGFIFSMMTTYTLSNIAVEVKWKERMNQAKTQLEIKEACADGGNRVFVALFFAPLEAIFYTWFFGYLGRHIVVSKKENLSKKEVFLSFIKKRPIIILFMMIGSLLLLLVYLIMKNIE